jgi:hypothetical protein
MPLHDWTRVEAFVFHGFHTRWIVHLMESLNDGPLPDGYYADCEQITRDTQDDGRTQPDLLTLHRPRELFDPPSAPETSAVALADAPPAVMCVPVPVTPRPRRHIVVRHRSGHQVIALIEIVSPANKDRIAHVEEFAGRVADALRAGIHVLILDLFPPGRHDPNGLHEAIIQQFSPSTYELPVPDGRTFAAYIGGPRDKAFIAHPRVGEELPVMPLFLTPEWYVNVPLASSYDMAWRGTPTVWREALTPPAAS